MDGLNFCFPIPERLENERVSLNPFIVECFDCTELWMKLTEDDNIYSIKPSKHAKLFMDQAILHPEIYRYLPFDPFKSVDDFVENFYEPRIRKDPGCILFAIFDKTKRNTSLNGNHTYKVPDSEEEGPTFESPLAGLIGLTQSSPINLVTELGPVIILPAFQRTHVTSNATGLLLEYALNLSSESPPGLALRRVAWKLNSLNKASVRVAERMGFKFEGVLRWERVVSPEKEEMGRRSREGDPRRDWLGIDATLFALCWDSWEDGGREKVNLVMQRVK